MITDQQTNTIYFSQKLEQVCPNLYHSISTLKEKGYPIVFFQGAKDIKSKGRFFWSVERGGALYI